MRIDNLDLYGYIALPWCVYADDLMLNLENKLSLQNANNLLNKMLTKYGLSVNAQKTETMIFSLPEEIPDFHR